MWDGEAWIGLPIPQSGGESVVVPNIAAVLSPNHGRDHILLQRRDKPGETVRGRLELPGGRWRAGESAITALRREVAEETGLVVVDDSTGSERFESTPMRPFVTSQPIAVSTGVEGAYPALHVAYLAIAVGEPRPQLGETAEPRWWPLGEIEAVMERDPEALTGVSFALLSIVLRSLRPA